MLLKTILKTTLFSSMFAFALAPVNAIEMRQKTPLYGDTLDNYNMIKFMPKEFNHGIMMASNASWYGPGFYGNTTACGDVYRPGTLTAAHKSLPCGTRVRVTDTYNGRSVVVRINDRGPYVHGRVIDLGEGAASKLGMKGRGVTRVRMQILN